MDKIYQFFKNIALHYTELIFFQSFEIIILLLSFNNFQYKKYFIVYDFVYFTIKREQEKQNKFSNVSKMHV